ncbi:hypothetical protein OEZ85_006438 [Tetradesmus obliquus]|uniref:Uncharacterized protein n=1 Tax=Tetradesmus obliquus TaxID=3088 RepID=A0ABY8TUX3_TETOB|nr:hypothetical protein OEZ85_006438 [Tetradesmus obliquus]
MALSVTRVGTFAPTRASVNKAAAPRLHVVCSSGKDNIYHDRETTKSRRSNPAGTKDAAIRKSEKDQQFEYQQERLEWRRKNQGEGIEDRDEPAVNNMAEDGASSSERRGPEVEGTSGHGDTLKELVDNITGKNKKKKEGK